MKVVEKKAKDEMIEKAGETEGARRATGCAWHGRTRGGESPLWDLLEVTMSRRQLHEETDDREAIRSFAVRPCGMEAEGEPQHRTRVNPRKAGLTWVSVPGTATPDIQPWQDGIEDGGGGTSFVLTQGGLCRSATAVGWKEATTTARRLQRSRIFP
jgi:hypothetical protein